MSNFNTFGGQLQDFGSNIELWTIIVKPGVRAELTVFLGCCIWSLGYGVLGLFTAFHWGYIKQLYNIYLNQVIFTTNVMKDKSMSKHHILSLIYLLTGHAQERRK